MAKIYDAEMQYLNVAIAKHIGFDDSNGAVAHFESDRITCEDAGLKPLLVYSITAPCYGVKARLLVDASAPIPISKFLSQAWSSSHGLGMPQRIELEDAMLASDRGFIAWAQSHGVICEHALSGKSLRAFARSAQDLRWAITFDRNNPSWEEAAPKLDAANKSLHGYDRFTMALSSGIRKSMEHSTFEAWMGREKQFFSGSDINDDWSPSSCLVAKPKSLPNRDLVARRSEDEDPQPPDVHGLKELIGMWPGGRRAFFRGMGCTARDFEHWIAGRAYLPNEAENQVLSKAGAIYDERIDDYRLGGCNVLVARTAKGLECVYDALSHGGDLEYAFEVIAPRTKELPMRVLVFAPWGGYATLIFIPRDGGRVESLIDRLSLINLTKARKAPDYVWDSLKWIFENQEHLENLQDVAMGFDVQHRDWLVGQTDTAG